MNMFMYGLTTLLVLGIWVLNVLVLIALIKGGKGG